MCCIGGQAPRLLPPNTARASADAYVGLPEFSASHRDEPSLPPAEHWLLSGMHASIHAHLPQSFPPPRCTQSARTQSARAHPVPLLRLAKTLSHGPGCSPPSGPDSVAQAGVRGALHSLVRVSPPSGLDSAAQARVRGALSTLWSLTPRRLPRRRASRTCWPGSATSDTRRWFERARARGRGPWRGGTVSQTQPITCEADKTANISVASRNP